MRRGWVYLSGNELACEDSGSRSLAATHTGTFRGGLGRKQTDRLLVFVILYSRVMLTRKASTP